MTTYYGISRRDGYGRTEDRVPEVLYRGDSASAQRLQERWREKGPTPDSSDPAVKLQLVHVEIDPEDDLIDASDNPRPGDMVQHPGMFEVHGVRLAEPYGIVRTVTRDGDLKVDLDHGIGIRQCKPTEVKLIMRGASVQ